jgi:isoamylase
MGDEVCRTQMGNNNAYCQDNELSWLDWSLLDKHADIHRFVKQLIRLRRIFYSWDQKPSPTLNQYFQQLHIEYHGVKLYHPDWGQDSHSLAILVSMPHRPYVIYFIFHSYWESLEFELPVTYQNARLNWSRVIDTALQSPDDCLAAEHAINISTNYYTAQARSIVILIAKN